MFEITFEVKKNAFRTIFLEHPAHHGILEIWGTVPLTEDKIFEHKSGFYDKIFVSKIILSIQNLRIKLFYSDILFVNSEFILLNVFNMIICTESL